MLSNEYVIGAEYSAYASCLVVNKHVEMLFSRCIDGSEALVLASDRENHHGQMGNLRPDLISVS